MIVTVRVVAFDKAFIVGGLFENILEVFSDSTFLLRCENRRLDAAQLSGLFSFRFTRYGQQSRLPFL